ncbi:Signal transduction histidine kinase [Saccharopolyspora antimicrobica]|uniref:histidine kinase n=1 Tax=Saccharopolyspora antimicrobica TaxID=455193 RepID=A0A1I5H495_9PSEU|nr:signal transduction histidine kinase [Saccharopolyspora antimicrobica]SFO43039.1 Signal transduction histidine kinase [Saccharopolyspora antimicrobica]
MNAVRWRHLTAEVLAVAIPAGAVLAAPDPFGYPAVSGLIAALLLPLRRRWPRIAVLLCLPALAGGLGWPASIVALFALGRAQPQARSLAWWVVLAAAVAVAPVLIFQSLQVGAIVLTLAYVLLAAGAPVALGALVSLRQKLAESLRRLEAATAAELEAKAETARADERARIAREIHDAVGHHVTLIAVESAALAATTADTEAKETASRLRGLAKQALDEMRATLGLGSTCRTGLDTIPELVGQARAAGVDVELTSELSDPDVPPAVERAAYRVVQEALTNASKHAPGAVIKVDLASRAGALHIVVTNGAPQGEPVDVGSGGSGLAGLSERVRMAGGQLDATPFEDGGFQLTAVLPKQR